MIKIIRGFMKASNALYLAREESNDQYVKLKCDAALEALFEAFPALVEVRKKLERIEP